MKFNKLTPEEERVIVNKGTEIPFSGEYNNFYELGIYTCKRCGTPLYKSADKFKSGCGWPSFDDEIPGAIKRLPDFDGRRTEIQCAHCEAHLGHIFEGEHFTPKNTRHCVNSVSLRFTPESTEATLKSNTAIVAGGCFWGVQYYMQKAKGVLSSEVGYIGGLSDIQPTYEQVCSHTTGYAEALRIIFNPQETTYEEILKLFFEIHDPTELNRQGPDIGDQYRSEIFYLNDAQKQIAEMLIELLKQKGYDVVTKVSKTSQFWRAEEYHQDYYDHKGSLPYCHRMVKRF